MSRGRVLSPYRGFGPDVWGPWRDLAACKDADPKIFFPVVVSDDDEAKRFCARCPVRAECLAAHLREPDGIWGGLNEKERRAVLRRVGRQT